MWSRSTERITLFASKDRRVCDRLLCVHCALGATTKWHEKVWVEFRRFGKFGRLSMLRVCIFKLPKHPKSAKPHEPSELSKPFEPPKHPKQTEQFSWLHQRRNA